MWTRSFKGIPVGMNTLRNAYGERRRLSKIGLAGDWLELAKLAQVEVTRQHELKFCFKPHSRGKAHDSSLLSPSRIVCDIHLSVSWSICGPSRSYKRYRVIAQSSQEGACSERVAGRSGLGTRTSPEVECQHHTCPEPQTILQYARQEKTAHLLTSFWSCAAGGEGRTRVEACSPQYLSPPPHHALADRYFSTRLLVYL